MGNVSLYAIGTWHSCKKYGEEFRFDLETVRCGENRAVLDSSATQARQQPLPRK
jgi:hypothetical protein